MADKRYKGTVAMIKRAAVITMVFALCCVALLAGCMSQSESSASEDAVYTDPLTGVEAQPTGKRPVGVVISNSNDVASQYGIASASVVIEALTEETEPTTLCLVYPSVDDVPQVGPVAGGKDIYWQLLSGQQILPVQYGGNAYNANYLDYYKISPVDVLEAGTKVFFCDDSWSNTPVWYTNGTLISGILGELNISSTLSQTKTAIVSTADDGETNISVPALLPFSANAHRPAFNCDDAASVKISFGTQSSTGFEYDAVNEAYKMLKNDGSKQIDAATGKCPAFKNLLLLYSASKLRDDDKTLDYDLSMGGGVWFCEGKMWNITWAQGSDTTLVFYDADGKQLSIEPGHSYIALVSSTTGQELAVSNSNGEAVY